MRQLLTYLVFRLGVGILGLMPARAAQVLGEWGGRIAYAFAHGRREMALRHARRLGSTDPVAHAKAVFAGYGRYWAEAFWLRPRRIRGLEQTTLIEGIEHVRQAKAEGRGFVCAIPHVGNWEVAGPVAVQEGIPLVAVAEDLANRYIRDWFIRLRNRLGIGIVLATGTATVMRELEAVLTRNGGVALLCDRDLRGKGVPVELFGERTTLPGGPVSLALRTGAPILPVAVYFQEGAGHKLVVRPPLQLPPGEDRQEALRLGTQAVAAALEDLIRVSPTQWHLLQPNWPSDRGTLE